MVVWEDGVVYVGATWQVAHELTEEYGSVLVVDITRDDLSGQDGSSASSD